MQYEWKLPGLFSVEAQDAGEELERICDKHGALVPHDVVDESRPKTAVLHPCFEWDDPKAAELYREQQARQIIRCVVVVQEDQKPQRVRAFHNVTANYEPVQVVVNDPVKLDKLLENAKAELRAFMVKYQILQQLQPVFDEISKLV